MKLRDALERPVLFVGGKGGVGKTTLAAAAALDSAERGTPTLLVSTDPAHSTGDILGLQLSAEARPVTDRMWALEIDPAQATEAYVNEVRARLADATPPRLLHEVERQIDVARVSPGAQEAAVFERFARILGEDRFPRLVFDTAPTGQTLRLLSLPEHLTAWIGGLISRRRKVSQLGRMWRNVAGAAAGSASESDDPILYALEERQDLFRRTRSTLTNPERTAFVFVVTPGHLPILETHRAMSALASHGIPVGGLLVNQILPDASGESFHQRRRARQAAHLADIESRFRDWPMGRVPLLDEVPVGVDGLARLRPLVRWTLERTT